MCQALNCERKAYARGHCARHYKQLLRHGEVQPERARQECAVAGCGRAAVTRGWCHAHYLRWSRNGHVDEEVPVGRPVRSGCTIDACGRRAHGRGLCRTHLRRLTVLGDPQPKTPVRPTGEGRWITHGYRAVVVPEHLRHLTRGESHALEHRLVMAVLLDRPLVAGESVHHRNGDRLDNRPGNLEPAAAERAARRGQARLRLRAPRAVRPGGLGSAAEPPPGKRTAQPRFVTGR